METELFPNYDHVDSMTLLELKANKPPGKRSAIWDEYLILTENESFDGKRRALCHHCKIASYIDESRNGTTNMRNHIKKCGSYKANIGEDSAFDQKTYRDLVARAIIKNGYAFSWVEHEGNREIHTYLNKQVRTITRNTAKSDCLKLQASLKANLKKTLCNIPGRICLTSDMWTSCQTKGYLCLTAHYVDDNWKLTSKVLNFCNIETPLTGQVMYSVVSNLLQGWDITHKIFSITLDNATSNDRMQDHIKNMLKGRGGLLYDGDFFHIRCAAHVLNLIVKDGLKKIDPIVGKIRESVKYVKGSEVRKNSFRKAVKNVGILGSRALWLDVPTRWNSTYMMLDIALYYRLEFQELEKLDTMYKHFPSDSEWKQAEKMRDLFEPFCDITELFSGRDYPTANLYFENVWKIAMLLKEYAQSSESDLRDISLDMNAKLDKYWAWSYSDYGDNDDGNYNTLFAFAIILDPRCKLPLLKYCYRKFFGNENHAFFKVNDVKSKLQRFLQEYAPKTNATSCETPLTSKETETNGCSHKRKFFEDFDMESSESLENTKLDIYLDDTKMDRSKKLDILNFWKENVHRYGELSHLARDVLTVALTTVASESTFSIGGRVLNKGRSSYLLENVEALITTRSWLYGYEPIEEDEFIGCDVEWSTSTTPDKHSY